MTGRVVVRTICTVFWPGSRNGAVSCADAQPAHSSAHHPHLKARIYF
jgi:hypothetical protein